MTDFGTAAPDSRLAAGYTLGDGRYLLVRLLGTGGMASVWLAHDLRLGRDVAVKILADTLALDAEFVARFASEARLAARLSHPNLVEVYDFCTQPRPYLVMQHVDGGTLSARMRDAEAPAPDVAAVARQLLAALAHVHRAGIVHRDLKPANILVTADDHVRLTDFGIAQRADATRITGTGLVLGTQRYCAPEVLCGEPATERSDLYALGVVLEECPGAHATPGLRALIAALTCADPAGRPASAAAAAALLAMPRQADGPPTVAWRPPLPPVEGPRTHLLPTVALGSGRIPRPRPAGDDAAGRSWAARARPAAAGAHERVAAALEARAERRTHARLLRPRAGGQTPALAGAAALALSTLVLMVGAGAAPDQPAAPSAAVPAAVPATDVHADGAPGPRTSKAITPEGAGKAGRSDEGGKSEKDGRSDALIRKLDRLQAGIDRARR